MAEEVGKRTRLGDDIAECVVGVLSDKVAGLIKVAGNITVIVVAGDVWRAIDDKI